jgi:hypothetical protein
VCHHAWIFCIYLSFGCIFNIYDSLCLSYPGLLHLT